GLPMGEHVGRAMFAAGAWRPIFVIGHGGDLVRDAFGDKYEYVVQGEPHGTGDACKMALPAIENFEGVVLVGSGDAPLVTGDSMRALVAEFETSGADCVVATCILDDPLGYGRMVRDDKGEVTAIVEEVDASEEQRKVKEINAAFYCFSSKALTELLPKLKNDNQKREYYLTDLVSIISSRGGTVATHVYGDADMLRGVNDRWQLAEAGRLMQQRILKSHALAGVTLEDPVTTYIGADVTIEPDAEIAGMTAIEGATRIGARCKIGSFCRIADSDIGADSVILMSHVNRASVGNGTRVGPYANLRPGTVLGPQVKVGNFVEVKNSEIGEGASMSHLTYVGDSRVGPRANIGAGTITCNYDGFAKHETIIGEDAFVGSNSTLVAPVEIGPGAITAAGSVITQNVPADSLGVGRSRQENKEGWAKVWRRNKKNQE
ncbi:MAG: bifunctional UDP-N-acetylglucosamine diphosphorylase/glucosamine-1-phosphate N-acetyltransferase GlmU, partial [Armatimonadetes bacterium]|nr:bifunctional UDP-N-acetylglucosamine diphosphorylase/glucosamine-1-phosphate N-acetyltransferase GlmU [Armatimonadota bacterium]